MDDFSENTKPTPRQNYLFQITIKNFVDTAKSHRQVLIDRCFAINGKDIDKWVQGRELSGDMSQRIHIMDFIWTHYCNCKCG